MRAKPGKLEELKAHLIDPQAAATRGYRGSYLLVTEEGDEVVVAVMYEDKDSYFEMVHDPRTDENYRRLLTLIEGEPSWTDGEWIAGSQP
jgi:hypothetical protein